MSPPHFFFVANRLILMGVLIYIIQGAYNMGLRGLKNIKRYHHSSTSQYIRLFYKKKTIFHAKKLMRFSRNLMEKLHHFSKLRHLHHTSQSKMTCDVSFFHFRYDAKMAQTEARMRALGLLTPSCVLTLDEWEIPRDRVVINRKLGEGAFGTVYGGEAFFDEKGWVSHVF